MIVSPALGTGPERGAGSSPAMGIRNSIIEVGSNGAYPPHNGIYCWSPPNGGTVYGENRI